MVELCSSRERSSQHWAFQGTGAASWAGTGTPPRGGQKLIFDAGFSLKFAQEGQRTPKDTKGHQERPKSGPRALQEPPRAPQEGVNN